MAVPPEQEEVAAFLRDLAGSDPLETHISLVFVGADAFATGAAGCFAVVSGLGDCDESARPDNTG